MGSTVTVTVVRIIIELVDSISRDGLDMYNVMYNAMYMHVCYMLSDIHECYSTQISGTTYLPLITVNSGSLNKDSRTQY